MSLPDEVIKKKIIEEAKDNPWVSYLCKHNQLSRATFYRWSEGDKKFKNAFWKAQRIGRLAMCDFSESKLMSHVSSPNEHVSLGAVKYVLSNNSPHYRQTNSFSQERRMLREQIGNIKFETNKKVDEGLNMMRKIFERENNSVVDGNSSEK